MNINVVQHHKLGTSLCILHYNRYENPFPGEKFSIQNNDKTIDKSKDANATKIALKYFIAGSNHPKIDTIFTKVSPKKKDKYVTRGGGITT